MSLYYLDEYLSFNNDKTFKARVEKSAKNVNSLEQRL